MTGLVLAVAVASLAACTGDVDDEGAVRGGPDEIPHPSVYLTEFAQGHTFSDAYSRVDLSGDTPGVLDRVEIIGGDGYFDVVGLKVAGVDRRFGSIQFAPNYPPHQPWALGPLSEGSGAPLTTEQAGSLLVVGMRVTRDGIGSRTGLRVYYSVDGRSYFQDHAAAIVNCPPGTPEAECDAAYEKSFDAAVDLADS